MSKNITIIFWGHPLYDGRCMNMIDQFINQNHKVSVLGIGNKSEKLNYKSAQIELIDKTKLRNVFTKYLRYKLQTRFYFNSLVTDYYSKNSNFKTDSVMLFRF